MTFTNGHLRGNYTSGRVPPVTARAKLPSEYPLCNKKLWIQVKTYSLHRQLDERLWLVLASSGLVRSCNH